MMKLLLVLAFVYLAVAQEVGICRFTPTTPAFQGIGGSISFTTTADGVLVQPAITGLNGLVGNTLGLVGIHVHTYGDIRPSEGTAGFNVGGHYNPTNVAYGCPGQAVRENGDMGNFTVEADGSVTQSKTLDLLALTGAQSIIGRAVVIHQSYDDCITLNSSRTRMAFCVIGVANTISGVNTASNADTTVQYGTCSLQSVAAGGAYAGLVTFTAGANGGVTVKANVTGIAGTHGIHVHTFGDLNGGAQIGGHYDPLGTKTHALPTFLPDSAHHIGDLGNICDSPDQNTYYYQATFNAATFGGANGIIGRAIAIHAGPDNSGNVTYGARVAYCVIGVAKADNLAAAFAPAPVAFTSPLCGFVAPTSAPATTSDASDFATFSVFIAVTLLLAMLF